MTFRVSTTFCRPLTWLLGTAGLSMVFWGRPADAQQPSHSVEDTTLDTSSVSEQGGKTYYFVGARYRGIIVPKFFMEIFGDGGRTVYVDALGPEFAMRKDGLEQNFSLWWADYGMEPTPFKSSSDSEEAWEIVESELNIIFASADFLWGKDIAPEFAVNFGMGIGLGVVFGDLKRVQSYSPSGAAGDPYSYEPCVAPGNPPGFYCGADNGHYTEPSWFDGGAKPVVFPWFALQTGARYKPHRNFVARLDLGFGLSGFFFGLGADYGL